MNYIKKQLKWIIVFVLLLVVLCLAIFFGGKDSPITEKENSSQETTINKEEISSKNGISIEDKDPYDNEDWGPIK